MKLLVVVMCAVFLLCGVGSCVADGLNDVVGVSYRADSEIALAVRDGSLCYRDIEWHIWTDSSETFRIVFDDKELRAGVVDGMKIVNTTVDAVGPHVYGVTVGGVFREYRVLVINVSAEEFVIAEYEESALDVHMSSSALLWTKIRVLVVTMVFFFASFPVIFQYVIDRKEKEARQIV